MTGFSVCKRHRPPSMHGSATSRPSSIARNATTSVLRILLLPSQNRLRDNADVGIDTMSLSPTNLLCLIVRGSISTGAGEGASEGAGEAIGEAATNAALKMHSLSRSAIIAIAVAIVVVILLCLPVYLCYCKWKARSREEKDRYKQTNTKGTEVMIRKRGAWCNRGRTRNTFNWPLPAYETA